MRKRPFLATGITSFFVALIGSNLSLTVMYTVGACLVAMTVVCVLCRRIPYRKTVAVMSAIAALTMAALACKTTVMLRQHTDYDGAEVSITVRVTDIRQEEERWEVCVESGDLPKGTKLYLWVGETGIDVREGDLATGKCEIAAAFDAQQLQNGRTAKAQGIYLYAWPKDDTVLNWHDGQSTVGIYRRALWRARQSISETLEANTTFAAPLYKAMMIGDRDGLSDRVKESFRSCGIYHVLAVSGLHVSVLVGALYWLLRTLRCPRRLRAVITMVAVWMFMALCDFSPSVTRAGVMTLIALASMLFRRRADGLNSLGLAATAMLLADPFAIYDVGWQLSFAATLGILCMGPVWQREITDRIAQWPSPLAAIAKPISGAVGVTTCATLTTMPITAYWYGELSAVALVCNMLLIPPTGLLLVLAFVGTFVETVMPSLSSGVFRLADHLTQLVYAVTQKMASASYSVVWGGDAAQIAWLFFLPLLLALAYRWFGMRGIGRAVALLSVLALLIACGSRCWWTPALEVRVINEEYPTYVVHGSDGVGVVVSGDTASIDTVQKLLLEEGVDKADWILWIGTVPSVLADAADKLYTDWLILTQEPSLHASLPQADRTYWLHDGETVTLTDTVVLSAYAGVYRVETEGISILTAMSDVECPLEHTAYLQADVAVLPALLPTYAEKMEVSQMVVCGEVYDVYRAWHTLSVNRDMCLRSPQTEDDLRLRFR